MILLKFPGSWRSLKRDTTLSAVGASTALTTYCCGRFLHVVQTGSWPSSAASTFKAYRRELLSQLPLYGEMHRFIPALASAYGASICEIPIHNKHRKHGVSHYNLSRTFRVMFDLLTIRFLLR